MNQKIKLGLMLSFFFTIFSGLLQAQISGQSPPVNTHINTSPTPTAQNQALVVGAPPFRLGEPVQVLWHGTWYPAHVIRVNLKRPLVRIHYDGYSHSWDEWVGADRIRK
ncbi:MAG: hypothetical protein HQM15_07945 [Deltaproteobacteria bacterium]|nr:hypothetical protein [Deltaproteobacteria bacterium]